MMKNLALTGALLTLVACGVDDHPGEVCSDTEPCPSGQECYRGFCVGEGCLEGTQTCVEGMFGACLGQVIPRTEVCNSKDDDCDGRVDEISGMECPTGMPGVCGVGTLACGDSGAICTPTTPASDEVCNSRDDDCDTRVDEGLEGDECYPAETEGCTIDDEGGVLCVGACRPGTFQCQEDMTRACVGAILPSVDPDTCTPPGELAADGDGLIDEDCDCTLDATQGCYGGAMGTDGVGPCMAGMQTCEMVDAETNRFGPCMGAVLPTTETCSNEGVDDDCDGMPDDVAMRGTACVEEGNIGACRNGTRDCVGTMLGCVTPEPTVGDVCNLADDDCDGTTDEDTDTSSDAAHCGMCGNACEHECCDGACTDVRFDEMNCGGCGMDGMACGMGQECCGGLCRSPAECAGCAEDCSASGTSCCSMACVDTMADENNCGTCGNTCEAGSFCCGGSCVPESPDSCGQSCTACGATDLCCAGGCVPQGALHCNTCGTGCGGDCCTDAHTGECVNLQTDESNCGVCGVECPSGDTCSNGMCCGAGLTNCDGTCLNVNGNDRNNCGSCGRRCANSGCGIAGLGAQSCSGGVCGCG
jgi:hypothetical protein